MDRHHRQPGHRGNEPPCPLLRLAAQALVQPPAACMQAGISSHYKARILRLPPVEQVLQILQEGFVLKVAVLCQPCLRQAAGAAQSGVEQRVAELTLPAPVSGPARQLDRVPCEDG